LCKFSEAKKAADAENKIKYFKILRALFENDLQLFAEVEKFIGFKPEIKFVDGQQQKLILKRKLDQTDK
jgi:hypothetical protein